MIMTNEEFIRDRLRRNDKRGGGGGGRRIRDYNCEQNLSNLWW